MQHATGTWATRIVLAAIVFAGAVLLFFALPAYAADKGGAGPSIAAQPQFLGIPGTEVPAAGSWTGFGIEGYGAWINADTDTSPVGIGSTGYAFGGSLTAALQMGSLVVEGFGDYGWIKGDLDKIGAETEYAVGGRAGFLANPSTFLYALAAKSWVETDAGTVDGWQYGGGVQYRFGASNLYGRLEYRHGEYDTSDILYVDAVTDTVRAGIAWKFPAGK